MYYGYIYSLRYIVVKSIIIPTVGTGVSNHI